MSTQSIRSNTKNLIFLFVILCTFSSCRDTANKKSYDTTGSSEEKRTLKEGSNRNYTDKESSFLHEAAEANRLEMQLCQLAQKKSMNSDVKELATMIELAGNKLKLELESIATKKSIDLLSQPNNRTNALAANLNHESTESFDSQFCDLVVKNNRNTIEMFDRAIPEINDKEIRNWAALTITGLVSRIDFAMTCQSKYQMTSK